MTSMDKWLIASAIIGFAILLVAGMRSAYYNGVGDGYGVSVEPNNPGYRDARRYLVDIMSHRWPWLKNLPETQEDNDGHH